MKKILSVFTLALAAGLLFVSCEKEPDTGSVVNESIYLTTGLPVSNEVYYSVTVDELTGKTESVGTNEISLKLCSNAEVKNVASATLKADFSKVPANATRMPEEGYSLVRATAEIAAGAKEAAETFLVTINAEAMPEAGIYALPLTIEATSDNTEVSATANTVTVRFIRNINKADTPEGWTKISSDRYTAGALENYVGWEYEGETVAEAFDGDLSTGWYSTVYDSSNGFATDSSYNYGCFAEVVFNEAVTLKGLTVAADPDSDWYGYRPRRLSIMFKYEGEEDYTWDKTYSYNTDEYIHQQVSLIEGDVESVPNYQCSPADFLITRPDYSTYNIDLTEKLADRKVSSMIILPATLYVGNVYELDENGYYLIDENGDYVKKYDEELHDYWYEYYYDIYYGTFVNEFVLFE